MRMSTKVWLGLVSTKVDVGSNWWDGRFSGFLWGRWIEYGISVFGGSG